MSHSTSERPFQSIHTNAWADPVDVPSLNKHVSDLIRDRIEQVRRAGATETRVLPSTSVLLLGPAGSGKTHIFARLRKQVGARAVFILSRPEIGIDPSPRHVLASIVDSLKQSVLGSEHSQLDVIAGSMLAAHGVGKDRYPFLVIDDLRREPRAEQRALIERVVERAEDRFPEISPQYLERLLFLPFEGRQERRACFAWLSGREPSPVELERIGAGGALGDLDLMPALRTIGVAAAFGAPIVLVFDQLENLAEESGKTGRILSYARLVSELRDRVGGLVIVQMALDSEWKTRIHPVLHGGDRARLEETVEMLHLPTPDERRALLEVWREALPEEEREKPFPYPFSTRDVDTWTKDLAMTPRMLMQACGEAYLHVRTKDSGDWAEGDNEKAESAVRLKSGVFAQPADVAAARGLEERLGIQWQEAMERARAEIDVAAQEERGVSAERIMSGLLVALRLLGIETAESTAKAAPSFRIPAASKRSRETDVLIAQHAHPRSLAATIRAAASLAKERSVILLREQVLALPPTWKEARRLLADFTALKGAVFMAAERDEIARILALSSFLTAARSSDLTGDDGRPIPYDEVWRWVQSNLNVLMSNTVEKMLAEPKPAAPPASIGEKVAHAAEGPGVVRSIMERLGVASVERIVREAKKRDPAATRAGVMLELRQMPVKFFGEAIVAMESQWP
ncbi:MAG: ATP-binding protein [Polyangiaceae bacterium]|nr:ATP-binding protein [Polyangiaceae bacterium]